MYKWWEEKGYFEPRGDPKKKSYVVPMPPPNVTGYLHMGHAMGTTLQVCLFVLVALLLSYFVLCALVFGSDDNRMATLLTADIFFHHELYQLLRTVCGTITTTININTWLTATAALLIFALRPPTAAL